MRYHHVQDFDNIIQNGNYAYLEVNQYFILNQGKLYQYDMDNLEEYKAKLVPESDAKNLEGLFTDKINTCLAIAIHDPVTHAIGLRHLHTNAYINNKGWDINKEIDKTIAQFRRIVKSEQKLEIALIGFNHLVGNTLNGGTTRYTPLAKKIMERKDIDYIHLGVGVVAKEPTTVLLSAENIFYHGINAQDEYKKETNYSFYRVSEIDENEIKLLERLTKILNKLEPSLYPNNFRTSCRPNLYLPMEKAFELYNQINELLKQKRLNAKDIELIEKEWSELQVQSFVNFKNAYKKQYESEYIKNPFSFMKDNIDKMNSFDEIEEHATRHTDSRSAKLLRSPPTWYRS